MKKIVIVILVFCTGSVAAQTERSLEETKDYIVRMINEYGWKQNSDTRRLRADFDGDLLKITTENRLFGRMAETPDVWDFTHIYRYKGPTKQPGDVAELIIWADLLVNPAADKWAKQNLEMDIRNYAVGEQLMNAFRRLNQLLLEKKPAVEKF
ncbi:hypothetical protein [Flavobacterium selenitireducens]|uniref:hypothetical protein n=1 Tax=Flavobacterium selenitireducens TaxID=2722704 RepID=UPI00168ADA60|nr:hypothetical protein [Flavobacterium selenitireducens]MBD3583522.1 hypothetical protein [Flavobacterium selenitireducens]